MSSRHKQISSRASATGQRCFPRWRQHALHIALTAILYIVSVGYFIEVLEAELQLATSATKRINNLQQQVSVLKELEAVLLQQNKGGKVTFDQVLAARADRAEARLNAETSTRGLNASPDSKDRPR